MIDFDDVQAAAKRLDGVAHRTPVLTSTTLDAMTGGRLYLKAENLQRIGAFKFRGAYNSVSVLAPDVRSRGVFAFSSGNHAQAVALSARLHDIPATILMPEDAPALKVAATRGYGAEIITYDRYTEDRAAIATRIAGERGLSLVPPYDHDPVMAGQGTAALELVDEAGELDTVVASVGGGGLLGGTATAVAARLPQAEVYGAEPEARPAGREAYTSGVNEAQPIARTIADGQQTPSLGHRTLEVIRERAAGIVGVPDDALIATMRLVFERLKIVLEPSGASALASVLSGRVDVRDRRVGIVLSGGNIDAGRFAELTRSVDPFDVLPRPSRPRPRR